jgi:putative ATP-binding cassette transporter
MDFLQTFRIAAAAWGWRLYVYLGLSAVCSTLITVIVNTVTEYDPSLGPDYELLASFVLISAILVFSRGETTRMMNAVGETVVFSIRTQFAHLLRAADYGMIEKLGAERIYGTLARNTPILAESPLILAHGLVATVSFALATLYVAWYSFIAALAVLLLIAVVALAGRYQKKRTENEMRQSQLDDRAFFDSLNQFLQGYKEVKLDHRRGADLVEKFVLARAHTARDSRLAAVDTMIKLGAIVFAAFYLLLATVVFITPEYVEDSRDAMKIVYASMFMWLLVEGVFQVFPTLAKAHSAHAEITAMSNALASGSSEETPPAEPLPALRTLQFEGLEYHYAKAEDGEPFGIGPCSLTLAPGELVFLVGNNGSGKTTLMRVLSGLYVPHRGRILWNGTTVDAKNRIDYRSHFATVFTDFHLFDRFYGFRELPADTVRQAIADVGLAKKTDYINELFTTLDLSRGQRHRLAVSLSILEDKEVYIYDEIAADQDPGFRAWIYEKFLPQLKGKGKAVLVVSHDDRYFHLADRVLAMEEGKLVPYTAQPITR